MAASPSGAGSPTASSRVVAVASPRRISSANLARDPRTGKGKRNSSLFPSLLNTHRACLSMTTFSKLYACMSSQWNEGNGYSSEIVFVLLGSRSHSFIRHSWAWWFRMWRVSSRPYRLKKTVICSRNVAIFIGKYNIVSQMIMPKPYFTLSSTVFKLFMV